MIEGNNRYVSPLTVPAIEDIHSMKDLGVDCNMRKHRVAISGTNIKLLDNQFQIKEPLEKMCELVNTQDNVLLKPCWYWHLFHTYKDLLKVTK